MSNARESAFVLGLVSELLSFHREGQRLSKFLVCEKPSNLPAEEEMPPG